MRYFAVSDNLDTLLGLRLAGIDGVEVRTPSEVRGALSRCIEDKDVGVILITEKLARLCPEQIDDLKLRLTRTLVVEIPDRHGTGRTPDSITRYIREAIGVKL
ncbi:MAG: V-type ATP synthase subunit F [Oscillospiraceae bacterium]|jgi:V/A-type H+-transporting ATPase subunit F|nr:V-type ATP synthase subunit F [Oscillospiraceae bacterium]